LDYRYTDGYIIAVLIGINSFATNYNSVKNLFSLASYFKQNSLQIKRVHFLFYHVEVRESLRFKNLTPIYYSKYAKLKIKFWPA